MSSSNPPSNLVLRKTVKIKRELRHGTDIFLARPRVSRPNRSFRHWGESRRLSMCTGKTQLLGVGYQQFSGRPDWRGKLITKIGLSRLYSTRI